MPEIILVKVKKWKEDDDKSIENYEWGFRVTTSDLRKNPYGENCGGLDASNHDQGSVESENIRMADAVGSSVQSAISKNGTTGI